MTDTVRVNWRNILLRWAYQSECLDSSVDDLEQLDVEIFYKNFQQKITATVIEENDVISFLKNYYPDFEVHLCDDGSVSTSEYMYMFSLFLHFSCIKYTDEYFQTVSKILPDEYQQPIAAFFNHIISENVIDKEKIRHAIEKSCSNSIVPFIPMESPVRTPKITKMSPPFTPRTVYEADLRKQINYLMALVDSERDEKNTIEQQLKSKEEHLERLVSEQKKYISKISKLENELILKAKDDFSCSGDKNGQTIKKLKKDIADRDEEILNLKESIEGLNEEIKSCSEKCENTKKQISFYVDKIEELNLVIDTLNLKIKEKESSVNGLTETVNELTTFIHETRTSSNPCYDLDSSAEYDVLSFSRNTNSSGSLSGPENLGCVVVDVQLKEKELECMELSKQLEKIKCENTKLANHIVQQMNKYSSNLSESDVGLLNVVSEDVTQAFLMFENFVNRLMNEYQTSKEYVEKQSKEMNDFKKEQSVVQNKLQELQRALVDRGNLIDSKDREYSHLKQNTSSVISKLEKQVSQLEGERKNVLLDIEALNSDLQSIRETLNVTQNAKITIEKDNCDLRKSLEQYKIDHLRQNERIQILEKSENVFKKERDNLENELTKLTDTIDQQNLAVQTLQNNIEKMATHNLELSENVSNYQQKCVTYELKVKELYKTLKHLEDTVQEKISCYGHLEKTFNDYKTTKEYELETIEKSVNDLKEIINEKCSLIEKLKEQEITLIEKIEDLNNNDQELRKQIHQREFEVDQMSERLQNLNDEVKELVSKKNMFQNNISELENINLELREKIKDIPKLSSQVTLFEGRCNSLEKLITIKEKLCEERLSLLIEADEKIQNGIRANVILQNKVTELENMYKTSMRKYEDLKIVEEKCTAENNEFKKTIKELREDLASGKTRNEELIGQVEQLAEELKVTSSNVHKIEEELKHAQEVKSSLKVENTNLETEIGSLVLKIKNFDLNLKNTQRENEEITGKCGSVSGQLRAAESKLNDYENDIKLAEETKSNLKKEKENLKMENINLNQTNHVLEGDLKILRCQTQKFSEDYNQLMTVVESLKSRLAVCEGQREDAVKMNSSLKSEVEELRDAKHKYEKLQKENVSLKYATSELEEKLVGLKNQNEDLMKLHENLSNKLKAINRKIHEFANKNKKCRILNKILNETMNESASRHEAKEKLIQFETENIEDVLDSTKDLQIYEALKAIEEKIFKENDNFKQNISDLESFADAFTIRDGDLKLKLKEMISKSDNSDRKLCELTQKYLDTQNLISNLETKIHNFEGSESKYEALKSEKNRVIEENIRLKEDVASVEARFVDCEKNKEEIERKYKETANLLQQHQDESQKLEKINAQLEGEIKEIKISTSMKQDSLDSEINRLRNECEMLKEQVKLAKDSVNSLEVKLDESQENDMKNKNIIGQSENEIKIMLNKIEKFELQQKENNEMIEKLKFEKCELLKSAAEGLSKKENQLQSITSENMEIKNTVQQMTNDIVKYEADTQKLNREISEMKDMCTTLQNLNKMMTEKCCNLEKEMIALKNEKTELAKLYNSERKEKEDLQNLHKNLNVKYEAVQLDITKLMEKSKNLEEMKINLNKRLENNSVKLGKTQGALSKSEKTNAELTTALSNKENEHEKTLTSFENLQKDHSKLLEKYKGLTEKYNSIMIQKENELKIQNLLEEKKNLEERMQDILKSETGLNEKMKSLEEHNECMLEFLNETHVLLKGIIKPEEAEADNKSEILAAKCKRLISCISELKALNVTLADAQKKSELTIDDLQQKNLNILSKMSKLSIKLDTTQNENDNLIIEVAKLHTEISGLKKEISDLTTVSADNKQIELDECKRKLVEEKELKEKLVADIKILHAKLSKSRESEKVWTEEKTKLIDELQRSEERIKENRFEMEGKLEKMKTKMKTLHINEVDKIKGKFEKEFTSQNVEIESLKTEKKKYIEHIQKLSQQIFTLNEKILELQKENKFYETQMKDTVKPIPQFWDFPPMNENESDELQSTFLTDFDNGRLPFEGRESVCASELQYRNSLAPRHLRSTYSIQYADQQLREEDIKDNILNNLDDSLTSLLNNGQRKKVGGTTSYKKPGPPTPSKNGGRFSLGGNEQLPKDILKDMNDTTCSKNEKKSSPVKSKSHFLSSKSKDENTPPMRRLSNIFKRNK